MVNEADPVADSLLVEQRFIWSKFINIGVMAL